MRRTEITVVEKLAIDGGAKAKPTPFHTPNRYGAEELVQLQEVIASGRLMGPGGKVRELEEKLEEFYGARHAVMVSSGTAALHSALAALGVAEGDEVITTPMTDIGTVSAILALHAIPIFADIDLDTRLLSPENARTRLSKRTRVIIAVHMAGLPCDMDAVLALAQEAGIKVLEDCAQSHGARYRERLLGIMGNAAGFSMNESKQVSCGDGGFVLSDDETTARIAALFRDKTYLRDTPVARGRQPIPYFALNYRPTCLQAAVGIAQLQKLPRVVRRRKEIAERYWRELGDLDFFELPRVVEGGEPSYWPLPARYTGSEPTRDRLVEVLAAEGIPISTGMTPPRNILLTELVSKRKYYPLTDRIPSFWRNTTYDPESCPNVDELQRTVMRLPVDERYTDEDVEQTIHGFRKVWRHFFAQG